MHVLVFLGVAISLLTHLAYIRDTLRGKTKPNKISWLMWTLAPLIGVGAALTDGARWAVLPTLGEGFVSLAVFVAAFVNPNAYWKLNRFDYLCGLLSLIALVMWLGVQEPTIAILFAIASDAFSTAPTIIKAWKNPESETGVVYIGALVAALTSFAGMQAWRIAEYAFPTFLLIGNSLLIFAVYRRRFNGRI